MADGMIIETSSNQLFRVWDDPGFDHAWMGVEVRRVRCSMGESYEPKARAKPVLVRKAATRVIEPF